jgi:hypothetical protein
VLVGARRDIVVSEGGDAMPRRAVAGKTIGIRGMLLRVSGLFVICRMFRHPVQFAGLMSMGRAVA